MSRRDWKRRNPTSLRHAIELCKDYARDVHNLSVERIADIMDEESHWTVYGWIRDGSIPSRKILGYQHACHCDFITRWLAHSAGKLLIDIPPGRLLDGDDTHRLQATLNAAVGALLGFAAGRMDADQVGAEINIALEALAWHRENVARHAEPELEFSHE